MTERNQSFKTAMIEIAGMTETPFPLFQTIDITHRGPVGWLLYSCAPRNAWTWNMLREHKDALELLSSDRDVRVIVLASALPRYFSVGADLAIFDGIIADGMRDWVDLCHACVALIRDAPKPVLAAINGVAVGGGLEFTYHADMRFAASDVRIGQPEITLGFIPPCGAAVALPRLMGRAQALRYLYDGELLQAQAAAKLGLVDEVLEPNQLHTTVQEYALSLANKSASGLAAIRRTITKATTSPFSEALALERDQAIALADTDDFQRGVQAFLKREGRLS